MASATEVLKPVQSSMFIAAGYDDTAWELYFHFKSTGEVRAYTGVSPDVADEVLGAKSIGTAYNQLVKGKFEHTIMPALGEPEPKKQPESEQGITDDDIRSVDPGYGLPPSGEVRLSASTAEVTSSSAVIAPVLDSDAQAAIALPQQKAPEVQSIIEQGQKHAQQAMTVKVFDAISYASAGQMLKILQAARERAFNFLDPIRAAVYAAYTLTQKKQREALDPIDDAIAFVKRGMATYSTEQERIRQQKLAEERRIAEEESQRRQKEASQQLTLAEVDDALAMGDTARADELILHPIEAPAEYVAPAYVAPATPQIEGVSMRSVWKVAEEEINLVTMLQAVKDGKFPVAQAANLLKPNVPALNQLAKSLRTAFAVPGVRAYEDTVIASRRGK